MPSRAPHVFRQHALVAGEAVQRQAAAQGIFYSLSKHLYEAKQEHSRQRLQATRLAHLTITMACKGNGSFFRDP